MAELVLVSDLLRLYMKNPMIVALVVVHAKNDGANQVTLTQAGEVDLKGRRRL